MWPNTASMILQTPAVTIYRVVVHHIKNLLWLMEFVYQFVTLQKPEGLICHLKLPTNQPSNELTKPT
jgi:hypothetical protein